MAVWCQESFNWKREEATIDDEEKNEVAATLDRELHSGSFENEQPVIRSAFRTRTLSTVSDHLFGFRVATTITP